MSNDNRRQFTSKNDVESPSSSAGKPRMDTRDFRRQAAFHAKKAGTKDWGAIMINHEETQEAGARPSKPKPPRYRKPTRNQKAEGPVKSETPSAPSTVLLYDGRAKGGRATTFVNCQNLSYSAFPLLVREMYTMMINNDSPLARLLPFCVFQHYLSTLLNATIIKRSLMQNLEQRFTNEVDPFEVVGADKMWVPVPFLEYLNGIGPALTASGDRVYMNLPEQGVPRLALNVNNVHVPSGSFGTCNAENHNAYEEYVSPLVTSNLVTKTRDAFLDHQYGPWNPLPGLSPPDSNATPNLLGYALAEHIRGETFNILQRFRFTDNATMAGRLRHSAELMEHVSSVLQSRSDKFNFRRGIPAEAGVNPAAFIISEVQNDVPSTEPLALNHGTLTNHEQFSESAANMSTYFTYKRRRSADAVGACYVGANNALLVGWDATRNSNLDMVFGPNYGIDFPHLRETRFEEVITAGFRDADIRLWLDKVFRNSS